MKGKIKNKLLLRKAEKMVLFFDHAKHYGNREERNRAERLITTKYYKENGLPKIEKGFLGIKKVVFEDMQYPTELYLLTKARRLKFKLEKLASKPHIYSTSMSISRVLRLVDQTKKLYQSGMNDEELDARADEFLDFVEKHIVLRRYGKTFRIAGREDVRKKEKRPDGKLKDLDDYIDDNLAFYQNYKTFIEEKISTKEEKGLN